MRLQQFVFLLFFASDAAPTGVVPTNAVPTVVPPTRVAPTGVPTDNQKSELKMHPVEVVVPAIHLVMAMICMPSTFRGSNTSEKMRLFTFTMASLFLCLFYIFGLQGYDRASLFCYYLVPAFDIVVAGWTFKNYIITLNKIHMGEDKIDPRDNARRFLMWGSFIPLLVLSIFVITLSPGSLASHDKDAPMKGLMLVYRIVLGVAGSTLLFYLGAIFLRMRAHVLAVGATVQKTQDSQLSRKRLLTRLWIQGWTHFLFGFLLLALELYLGYKIFKDNSSGMIPSVLARLLALAVLPLIWYPLAWVKFWRIITCTAAPKTGKGTSSHKSKATVVAKAILVVDTKSVAKKHQVLVE